MTFDISYWYTMTFDIWHMTFDIWHLTWLKVLTALILMKLAQFYQIFTDWFWGYLRNLKSLVTHSLTHNMDLRDASASKNDYLLCWTRCGKSAWNVEPFCGILVTFSRLVLFLFKIVICFPCDIRTSGHSGTLRDFIIVVWATVCCILPCNKK